MYPQHTNKRAGHIPRHGPVSLEDYIRPAKDSRKSRSSPIVNPNIGTGPSLMMGTSRLNRQENMQSSGNNQTLGTNRPMDVYAPSYVPHFIKDINNWPAQSCRSNPLPSIDFEQYISTFAGSAMLGKVEQPLLVNPCPLMGNRSSFPCSPKVYFTFFQQLLEAEMHAALFTYADYNLYNVPLLQYDTSQHLYEIWVPGIKEDNPPVKLNDLILLRQLFVNPYVPLSADTVSFDGWERDGYIQAIQRVHGKLIVKVDHLTQTSMRFNVMFQLPQTLAPQMAAVQTIGDRLNQISKNDFMRQMLFPEVNDGVLQTSLPRGVFPHRVWFDQNLNYEQEKAVDAVLSRNYGTMPFIISGIPGCGKTLCCVEIALQHVLKPPLETQHRLLLLAPSDQAADTIATRLGAYLNPQQLFRLQDNRRAFSEVPDRLLPYCFVDHDKGDMFGLPAWRDLMSFSVVVCSCKDANILVRARCTNTDLFHLQNEIERTLQLKRMSSSAQSRALHWTGLILDEAAQGTEAEIGMALNVLAPPLDFNGPVPFFVLAGDQQQLGPRLFSKIPDLEKSLLERLSELPVYSQHPLSRKYVADHGSKQHPQAILPYMRPPFVNLLRNYRSHPAILSVPSAIFYYDSLINEAQNVDGMVTWDGWQGRKWPVLFVENRGRDEWEDEGSSYYNLDEIKIVAQLVLSLVHSSLIEAHQIAVMSPFREQVKRIRARLRDIGEGLWMVNVGPVEAFQGAEHRVVILCTTRNREQFLDQDMKKGHGIIFERKRLTVATTRAKEGLIYIGNPLILQKDPAWRAILSFCYRHGLMRDMSFSGPSSIGTHTKWAPSESEIATPEYVGRIERGLLYSETTNTTQQAPRGQLNSTAADSDDAMYLAARTAELLLNKEDFDDDEF